MLRAKRLPAPDHVHLKAVEETAMSALKRSGGGRRGRHDVLVDGRLRRSSLGEMRFPTAYVETSAVPTSGVAQEVIIVSERCRCSSRAILEDSRINHDRRQSYFSLTLYYLDLRLDCGCLEGRPKTCQDGYRNED